MLLEYINCKNSTGDPNAGPPAVEFELERQFGVFFYVNLFAFFIYTSFAIYNIKKSEYKMDRKAWANMGVYILSFGVKAIAWTYMIS